MTFKTAKRCLLDNDKQAANELLQRLKDGNIPFENPALHASILGYPYNKGEFENDPTNGIRRLMVELKVLSVFGKHTCPEILLK